MSYQYNNQFSQYDYNMLQQQIQMQQQQPYYDTMQMYAAQQPHMRKTTKRDILAYLQQLSGASEIVQVDEFETQRTRHICQGTKQIQMLEKGIQPVQTSDGWINIEYFLCQNCRKLILNKQCLDMN